MNDSTGSKQTKSSSSKLLNLYKGKWSHIVIHFQVFELRNKTRVLIFHQLVAKTCNKVNSYADDIIVFSWLASENLVLLSAHPSV